MPCLVDRWRCVWCKLTAVCKRSWELQVCSCEVRVCCTRVVACKLTRTCVLHSLALSLLQCAYMCVRQIQWGPDDEEEAMLIRDTARRNLEKFVKENWGRSADSLLPVTDTTVYASPVHRLGVACTELMLEAYARSGLLPERRDLTLGRNGANVGMFRGKIDGCFADYHASLGEAGGAAGTAGVQQQGSERQWEVKLGEEVLVRWPGQDAEEAFKVTNASKAAAEVEMLAMRFEGLLSFDEIQDLRLIVRVLRPLLPPLPLPHRLLTLALLRARCHLYCTLLIHLCSILTCTCMYTLSSSLFPF